MFLTAIEIDRLEARKKFLEYRNSVRARHNAEDEQIMRGYRALAQGKQVIDIVATMRAGGVIDLRDSDNNIRTVPRLAIMRADAPWCYLHIDSRNITFYKGQFSPTSRETRYVTRIPKTALPEVAKGWASFKAMVPPVPPGLRPADKIGNYHILFEAEWKAEPPGDPALLKHIGGDLYAVLATWDLTELERTVLAGRFR